VYDMLNHEGQADQITSDYDYEKRALKMYAIRDFKKGEQIKIFYGPRSNRDFFFFQGFTLPLNSHNYTTVNFQLPNTDKLREKKLEILKKQNLPPPEVSAYFIGLTEPLSSFLLGFMRLALITNEPDLAKAESGFKGEIISIDNEERMLTMLEIKFQQTLDKFPTKIEEDEKAQKVARTKMDYHIFQLLIDEKKILAAALKAAKEKKKKTCEEKKEARVATTNSC